MDISLVLGSLGVALALIAYIPQIRHLIREQCVAGLSQRAYMLWFAAAALLLVRAGWVQDVVFIVLQTLNVLTTGIILWYIVRYAGKTCPTHQPSAASDH